MKPKSMKMRFLVSLYALFKYSDKDHRMSSIDLNTFLSVYNLQSTNYALTDTVNVLREFGIDIGVKGIWDNQGIWLKSRPLNDEQLNALIFAVTTNPHINKETAEEILSPLSSVLTAYQEHLLKSHIINIGGNITNHELYEKYMVIQDAIVSKRRIRYSKKFLEYNKENKSVKIAEQWPTLFTPKHIIQKNNKLYMFGYNNTDKHIETVELEDIGDIKIAFKINDPMGSEINKILNRIDIDNDGKLYSLQPLYKGPVVFKCRAPQALKLYKMFGPPNSEIEKDVRSRMIYPIEYAEIWPETIFELSMLPNNTVRIIDPPELRDLIARHCRLAGSTLVNPRMPRGLK